MDLSTDLDQLVSDIGLSLPSAKGRKAAALLVGHPRPLTAEDAAAAHSAPEGALPTSHAPVVKQLRSRHHTLAQMLAQGMSEQIAAITSGYSLSRISILKADPAFKELLQYYTTQNKLVAIEVAERMAQLTGEALEELQNRLDEESDSVTNKELMALSEMLLDRTGHGKSQTVKLTHGVDDETLELLKANVNGKKQGQITDLSAEDGRPVIEASFEEILAGPISDFTETEEAPYEDNQEPPSRPLPGRTPGLYSEPETEERLDDREGTELPEGVHRLY